jgi:hypothetical protein
MGYNVAGAYGAGEHSFAIYTNEIERLRESASKYEPLGPIELRKHLDNVRALSENLSTFFRDVLRKHTQVSSPLGTSPEARR